MKLTQMLGFCLLAPLIELDVNNKELSIGQAVQGHFANI